MSSASQAILTQLQAVSAERHRRAASPELASKVSAVKTYQQARFRQTYADLLGSTRYGSAARFFLQELYGPGDFARRDSQFARVVPALVRLFPADMVETVSAVAKLHALSENLDTGIAAHLPQVPVSGLGYVLAWQLQNERQGRQAQVAMTVDIARRLDHLTRRTLLRATLRTMRGPAHAAGLGELQTFLESGFDAFKTLGGAAEFIAIIETREKALADALFAADLSSGASHVAALDMLP